MKECSVNQELLCVKNTQVQVGVTLGKTTQGVRHE